MQCVEDSIPIFAKRGGTRNVKILPHHEEFIVSLIEDPVLGMETARQVNDKFSEDFELSVLDSAVNRALRCLTFTKKKILIFLILLMQKLTYKHVKITLLN